eukprot:TRINITY_DN12477_c0_g1_i1.p2 TRINITY_DN12477_c0_g1~~TRINITY_DN12477_c0_g1_i1.p2  ORF type:complete len:103 (+),score=14.66 TRINITY_DN12477_c0_g1_i1:260-568(+)
MISKCMNPNFYVDLQRPEPKRTKQLQLIVAELLDAWTPIYKGKSVTQFSHKPSYMHLVCGDPIRPHRMFGLLFSVSVHECECVHVLRERERERERERGILAE